MDEDAHGTFVDDGIELAFLGGGGVEAVIVEGEEPGVVVLEGGFCPGEDHLYLLVGIVVVIVVGDGVLDEAADLFDLFAIVGGFGGEGAVLEPLGVGEGIVHAVLRPECQAKTREYP
jgi:hypothetical protein